MLSMKTKKEHLASVIAVLERRSQRATYGAVGGIVDLPAQSVMHGEAKSHRNSWVVSAKSGVPSGYTKDEWSPALKKNHEIIRSQAALAEWLKSQP